MQQILPSLNVYANRNFLIGNYCGSTIIAPDPDHLEFVVINKGDSNTGGFWNWWSGGPQPEIKASVLIPNQSPKTTPTHEKLTGVLKEVMSNSYTNSNCWTQLGIESDVLLIAEKKGENQSFDTAQSK